LARSARFEFVYVPHPGSVPAVQNLVGDHIAAAILLIDFPVPYIQSGSAEVPEVQTSARRDTFCD
jgi:hypothetical protein